MIPSSNHYTRMSSPGLQPAVLLLVRDAVPALTVVRGVVMLHRHAADVLLEH